MKLVKSSSVDIDRLIMYEKNIIYEYVKDLSDDENRINNHVIDNVIKLIDDNNC